MGDWTDNGAMFALAALGAIAVGSEFAGRRWGSRALTQAERDVLPASAFAIPSERKFPMPDLAYGKRALTYAMWPDNASHRQAVKKAVFARYPSLIGWWNSTQWVRAHPQEAYAAASKTARIDLNAILSRVA